MRIRNARPVHFEPTPRGFNTIARMELEPVPGVVIFDCVIVQAPDGRKLVYGPPAKNNAPILSLAPDVRHEVIQMTLDQIGIYNDRHTATAA